LCNKAPLSGGSPETKNLPKTKNLESRNQKFTKFTKNTKAKLNAFFEARAILRFQNLTAGAAPKKNCSAQFFQIAGPRFVVKSKSSITELILTIKSLDFPKMKKTTTVRTVLR